MIHLPTLLFSAYGPYALRRFQKSCQVPSHLQRSLLGHILQKNAETSYGKKHRFAEICDFKDFQSQVPLADYETLEPFIKKAMEGDAAQLTIEKPILYGMTSGTTGSTKFIPVTPESKQNKARLLKLWLSALYRDHPQVFHNRLFVIVSPEAESYAPDGTPCGAESGHGYQNAPMVIKKMYACPYEAFTIKDYRTKYYLILRMAAEHPVSFIYTCNPSTVALIAELLGEFSESIIADIQDGTISSSRTPELSTKDLAQFKNTCARNARRAKFLKTAAKKENGKLLPKHVWPELAAIGCWKGGTVGFQLKEATHDYSENIPVRDIGYFATELRGSIPLSDDGCDGVLTIDTNIYEFALAEEEHPLPSSLLLPENLAVGEKYIPYVTTTSGLYRYNMNDVIEVAGFYEKTPIIRFLHKTKGIVSLIGEKLSEAQVLSAVEKAFRSLQTKYHFIAAVGVTSENTKPFYLFLVEFSSLPTAMEIAPVLRSLDEALKRHNSEYAQKRDSLRLSLPQIRIVKEGTFKKYQESEVAKGRIDTQFKILRVTTDETFADRFPAEQEFSLEEEAQAKAAGMH